MSRVPEGVRRGFAYTAATVCWAWVMVGSVLRSQDLISVNWGATVTAASAVAIAATLTLSRMRLSRTISDVFESGLRVGYENGKHKREEPDGTS